MENIDFPFSVPFSVYLNLYFNGKAGVVIMKFV